MLDKYCLAKIAFIKKPFGLKGELSTQLFVAGQQDLSNLPVVYITDETTFIIPAFIQEIRKSGGQYILSLRNIKTRTEAEKYRGGYLVCPKKDLVHLSPDHQNWPLLEVCVKDEKFGEIGIVHQIIPTPAYDILLTINQKGQKFFIPYQKQFILSYSHEKRSAYVAIPEELLQDET